MGKSTINKIEGLNKRLRSGGFSWSHDDYYLLQAKLPEIISILKKESHFDKLEQLTYDYATGKTGGSPIVKYVQEVLD